MRLYGGRRPKLRLRSRKTTISSVEKKLISNNTTFKLPLWLHFTKNMACRLNKIRQHLAALWFPDTKNVEVDQRVLIIERFIEGQDFLLEAESYDRTKALVLYSIIIQFSLQ